MSHYSRPQSPYEYSHPYFLPWPTTQQASSLLESRVECRDIHRYGEASHSHHYLPNLANNRERERERERRRDGDCSVLPRAAASRRGLLRWGAASYPSARLGSALAVRVCCCPPAGSIGSFRFGRVPIWCTSLNSSISRAIFREGICRETPAVWSIRLVLLPRMMPDGTLQRGIRGSVS